METATQTDSLPLAKWQQELRDMEAMDILKWAVSKFGNSLRFASSLGLEDQVITDMISKVTPTLKVFTLDTGRLFQESYDLIHRIEERYKIKVNIYFPDTSEVEDMVRRQGVNLFRQSVENRKLCCRIRKIHPLRRALRGLDAWVCGLRKGQSSSRERTEKIEWDDGNNLVKINPLVDWSEQAIWNYIKENDVPYNVLHDQNYPSIGCSCCTRAVHSGQDSRAGRWWWEKEEDHKECGLHIVDGKIIPPGG